MLGMQLIVVDDITETVLVKTPKRKHSRRWVKKFRKKYGETFVSRPTIPNDEYMLTGNFVYGSVRAIARLKSETKSLMNLGRQNLSLYNF